MIVEDFTLNVNLFIKNVKIAKGDRATEYTVLFLIRILRHNEYTWTLKQLKESYIVKHKHKNNNKSSPW